MKIEHTAGSQSGQFKAIENDQELGVMTYKCDGNNLISIDNTEVSPAFEGKGVGHFLVNAAVRYAREKHLKIRPMCWFVSLVLNRTPGYKDVLA